MLRYLGQGRGEIPPLLWSLHSRLDALQARLRGLTVAIVYARAVSTAVMGDPGGALKALDQQFSAGNIPYWWWIMRSHPAFAKLHDAPRFKALIAASVAHAAEQRALLAEMRSDGRALPQSPVEAEATESAQHTSRFEAMK
jgi:hypothetical protein